jgi:hypothetical protein
VSKSASSTSPVIPGQYLVFIERLVQEQYQTLTVSASSEAQAQTDALAQFFAGSVAYMRSVQVEAPSARVRPLREKHLRRSEPLAHDAALGQPFHTSERFEGPQSERIEPTTAYPGTQPAPVSRAQARLMCQNFDASGHSNHSGRGSTLWVILEHCAQADIAYNLRAMPGVGYYIERAKSADDGLALRMSVETGYGPMHS